ncbi:52 kDa repressor of the inhibitor of the protein kinase-like [Hemicordylus capensis]|uniref:52 kDa repressor of the inhibitor of the protein kinase-like n=1 Tax=Hemicordylus capensis TaxID=884348 RepID=UPI0023043EFC|nr:52 kDa repressor of the inhibitor of the protein kinase-like [Hemicordylus capensis]
MPPKKASGAAGRKRRRLEAEEAQRSSRILESFFARPGTSSSTPPPTESPAQVEEEVQPDEGGSSTHPPQVEEGVQPDEEAEAATESVDVTGGEASGDVGSTDESETEPKEEEDTMCSELDADQEPLTVRPEVIERHDIGLLQFDKATGRPVIPDMLREEMIRLGAKYFQNSEGPFLPTKNRVMNKTWFRKRLGGGCGADVDRPWMLYSPSKRSAFCFCCLLFSRSEHQSTLEQESGFKNWKKPERISVHENAKNHLECFAQWIEMERNIAGNRGLIDAELRSQIEKEKQRWREILTRILNCIKYLATQNLPLRGHRESLQLYDTNVGNFLGLVKLMATCDPVMKEHLTHVESHPGSTSYLSPAVQNEFIHLMASTVRKSILGGIRKAKYYGLMFDSTPDLAHREQMSQVVQYVEIDYESHTVRVRESFLGFIKLSQKDAESLTKDILEKLEKDGMELQDCRSQCYDNAAVMAGHRSGVAQRIREQNKLAVFVNCDNHSLNLVGVHAAKEDVEMESFFGTIDSLYAFFSRSTQRWQRLRDAVPVSLKSESETRWSSRTEAVKPVNNHLERILEVLLDMRDDADETVESGSDAKHLRIHLLSYEFLTLLGFWNKILARIDSVQKRLQDPKMNFHNAELHLKVLQDCFHVSEALDVGHRLCEEWDVDFERRPRRKKRMPGEKSRDAGLTAREEMERVMKGALDRLNRELGERFTRLHDTDAKFGFLLDSEGLCYSADTENLKNNCENFCTMYSTDVDVALYDELLVCRMLLAARTDMRVARPEQLLEFIVQYGYDATFPNLRIAVQIILTIAISVASCERSFSKLKLILSCLRTSMGQDRLCDLALLSIEREETEKTN